MQKFEIFATYFEIQDGNVMKFRTEKECNIFFFFVGDVSLSMKAESNEPTKHT